MSTTTKRILVCPLDWGLGHATRSVPVVHALLAKGHDVELASSGRALDFLKVEFPQLIMHELPGYNVQYSVKNGVLLPLTLSSLRITQIIGKEQKQTEQLVLSRSIDAVISDNRYGCHSARVPSAIITHQLSPVMPDGLGFLGFMVDNFITNYIKVFNYCWIPDEEGCQFSGDLSNSRSVPLRFIGILSRMQVLPPQQREGILALVSGPEPQRAIFEKMLRGTLAKSGIPYLVVRGLPRQTDDSNGKILDHLSTLELNNAIARSALVISRSGYSSIMDMAVAGGKAFFVPTPGQTEQEYLAKRFHEKGIAAFQQQKEFNIADAVRLSEKYSGFQPTAPSSHLLSKEIDILLGQ